MGVFVDEQGIPHINGKPATFDESDPLLDCFSQWRCPECNAHLSAKGFIRLNACHLGPGGPGRFARYLRASSEAGRSGA